MLTFICKEIATAQETFCNGVLGLKIAHPKAFNGY